MRRIAVLDAPSNLGLRPPTETSVPGCAKAPGALRDHGLLTRLGARDAGCLTPPRYDAGDWRPGDGVAHAAQIAAYSRALADRIGAILDAGEFPVILGGDCSILLGSGIAMHRLGRAVDGHIGLVFVDGHSDFRHPGNASYVGAAAGEDLALVTGRGQPDLASIEGRRPYFRDVDVVVLGIRAQDEYRLDLQAAGIVTRPVPALRAEGAARSAQWARDQLTDCAGYWVHVDVDVLDPAVMPAVDAPSPGGIAFPELELLLAGLVESPHCLGVEITVFDPDYDPDGDYAAEITSALTAGLSAAHRVALRPDLAAARRDLDRVPRQPTADPAPDDATPRRAVGLRRTADARFDSGPGRAGDGRSESGAGHAGDERFESESDRAVDDRYESEKARERRRAEAAAESVSLAAAGASGGDFGTDDEPALPATTLLAVEDGGDLPAEQPSGEPLASAGTADELDSTHMSDKSGAEWLSEPSAKDSLDAAANAWADSAADLRADPSVDLGADPAAADLRADPAADFRAEPAADFRADPAADFRTGSLADPSPDAADSRADLSVGSSADSDAESWGDPNPEPLADGASDSLTDGVSESSAESRAELSTSSGVDEVAESVTEPVRSVTDEHAAAQNGAGHEGGRLGGRRAGLGPRRGAADSEASARWLTRTLGSAPLLDSEPLPATRPGMLRPRRSEPVADQPSPADPETDGFTLPIQRPAFDAGSDEPADIA